MFNYCAGGFLCLTSIFLIASGDVRIFIINYIEPYIKLCVLFVFELYRFLNNTI